MPSTILNLDSSYSNYILNSKNTSGSTLNSFHTVINRGITLTWRSPEVE